MRAARARQSAIGARATRRASSTRARRDAARVGASAASKSSSPSSERDDIGADGAGVAVVGVGARGCALVDALVDARALPRAEMWAMHADEDALERSRAANRWRLPPANVEATTTAIEGNAASAARAVMAMGAPRVMVVVCAGGEAVESATAFTRWATREKNARAKKKRFFGFKGANRAPEGEIMIAGVIEPFTFEGRRKQRGCDEFLRACAEPGACDAALTVSQSELLKNGEDGMSVQDATSIADASLLYAVLSAVESLRSSCWSSGGERDASDVDAWTPQIEKGGRLRATVNKVMSSHGGGCGVAHVGRGVADVPTYGSADEAIAAAARAAIATAARQSPFLAPGRFDTARLVICTVKHGNAFGPLARATISQALSELTSAEQFISIANPDKRGSTEVEVTLLTVTDAETAAAPAPESKTVPVVSEDPLHKSNPMLFVPGYVAGEEQTKRKTTKLSRDDLKNFGNDDTQAIVATEERAVIFTSDQLATTAVIAPEVTGAERSSRSAALPLPRDFATKQVTVRVSEPRMDESGNVIGYKTLQGEEPDKKSSPVKTLFGWRPDKPKKQEKSELSRRALGMLEQDGKRRGAAVRMEFANTSVYEGEWADGKREGVGRQVFADGDWYEGNWFADLPDGKGKLSFKTGENSFFEGMFNAGVPDGPGKLVRTSGDELVGMWRDGAYVDEEN